MLYQGSISCIIVVSLARWEMKTTSTTTTFRQCSEWIKMEKEKGKVFLRSSCCDSLQWTNASIKILKVHVWLAFLWGAPLYRLFFSLVLVVMYAKFYALSTNKKAHRIALLCELTLNNQHKMCVEFFVHLPINTAIVQKENCYVGAHGIHHEP